jgi:SRSO17 transposase
VRGLLADLPRKHCWTLAEHAGDATPDGMQHLLGRAVWDHDRVRDDLRAYLVEHLGDPEARALDAGVPAAWVTGDEVYGADPGLRAELETRGIG